MNKPVKDMAAPDASRRELIIGAAVVGGALLVGGCSMGDAMSLGGKAEIGAFGPFLKIAPDGLVTVMSKHVELGQGSTAGLAAIVAEELDADWSKVKVEQAPANAKAYANGMFGIQGTGGSSAINNSWEQLRKAGAGAKAMFVQAAAARWSVPAGEIAVKDGVVSHAASGKQATFAELHADAARQTPPAAPILKDSKSFTLVGTDRVRRKDAQAKSDGTARFTQDVRKPDMLIAMVAHAPRHGGKLTSFDAGEARKAPGVVDVFEIPSGVAVTAHNTWAARQGRDAVKATWDEAKVDKRGDDQILADFKAIAAGKAPADKKLKWEVFETRGDLAKPPQGEAVEFTYDFPYLAHAAMEPMNCVAEVNGDKVKLTFASQLPTIDQLNAGKAVLSLPGAVEIDITFAGGSFGRRGTFQSDYVMDAVNIAKKVGKGRPVKMIWSREDDMTGGYYRPLTHHAVRVTVDKDGYPAAWRHRIVTQSIQKNAPVGPKGVDRSAVEGAMGSPYLKATPVVDGQVIHPDAGVVVHFWRSVGATHTAFVMEHTIDQLARKAGKDPVDYRRALYRKAGAARHLAVLNLAAEKSGWGDPAPAGWTRGLAVHESFGSVVAQVAEVKVENGAPKVGRVVTVIDCGTAVSPDQVRAQMEGGTCYGLSAALFGQITLKDGQVQQTNFDSYRVLRNSEAPEVETYIVASTAHPSGVGEPGAPVIGPAVANALLAIDGKPTTSLPFVKAQRV
jgi:isoquinoline 1-oxidoreductase beta subunit